MNKPTTPTRFLDLWNVVFRADPIKARQIQDRMVADLIASQTAADELLARRHVRLAMLRWNLWAVHGLPMASILLAMLARFGETNAIAASAFNISASFVAIFYVAMFIVPQKYGIRSEILRSKGVALE